MINEKLLEAAADWCIKQITTNSPNWDNGARREDMGATADMMWLLGNYSALKSREGITPEKIEIFKKTLIEQVKDRNSVILVVDYGPDQFLYEAAKKADIESNAFPCKTVMWIDNKGVSARLGYGAEVKTICKI